MHKKTITFLLSCLLTTSAAIQVDAQQPIRHELIRGDLPPGEAAHFYQQADPSLIGHTQPVQLVAPNDTTIEVGDAASSFGQAQDSQMTVAMGIGYVYRFKLSNLPLPEAANKTLYPSIEVIGKLSPPRGMENDFPVQVVVTRDDIDLALSGRMVTRVIYLEASRDPLPHLHTVAEQPSVDIARGQDPLRAAEQLGRPMAILRMGSRVPMPNEVAEWFTFGVAAPRVLPNPRPVNVAGLNERELNIVRAMKQAEAEAKTRSQLEVESPLVSGSEVQQEKSVSKADFDTGDTAQLELSPTANEEIVDNSWDNIGTISQTVEQPEANYQSVIANPSVVAAASKLVGKPGWIPVKANAEAIQTPQHERSGIRDRILIRASKVNNETNATPPAPSMSTLYFEPLKDIAAEAKLPVVQSFTDYPELDYPELNYPKLDQPESTQRLVAPMRIRRPNEL